MARVLVTGGAGYVGSVLVPKLLAQGHQVRVLDNLMYRQTSLLPYLIDRRLEFVLGDIRYEETVKNALEGVDYVVHLAAIVSAPACARDPVLAEEVNFEGTVLIDRCRSPSQGLLMASTGSNYGAVDGVCTEETPLNALSTYGTTKTRAEQAVLESGNVVVYRFATAFGLSPRLRLDLMVNDFVLEAVKNRRLVVYEKGFRRTFIHVQDMALAILHAVDSHESMKDHAYNVGHESMNYTKEEVALTLKKRLDYQVYFADTASDPDKRDYEVSYQKIRAPGFETSITLEEGLDELIKGCAMLSLHNPYSNVDS